MKRFAAAWLRDERGNAAVLVGLALLLMLTATGLVMDGGAMYAAKSHLQKAANAAALSGAQELTGEETDVRSVVEEILAKHGEQADLTMEDVKMGDSLRVHLRKKVPLGFSRLLGKEEATVEAEAAARISPMGSAEGVAPLGIDESIPLEFNKTYKLKVDSSGVEAGYFGVLALGGPGASTYESNLRYGYQSEIKLGDIIDTQTGNIAGKTRDGIQWRIDSDPYPSGDYSHRDSPRVILIPVYRPYNQTSNQLKQIQVTGFAYFYIAEPMSSKDTSITGMFIERTGTGYAQPGADVKGAYAIRLIE
ncbi:pilus assembly protein TadG-related protein [Cohnella caldifontis]|uniref:pilus assembly protein TadG-related protein n=1 Tax=Cohnella caldifontis TaxID=3027471 RepID=UPI0023ED1B04|nr:pilus assembly protein TadG-related protein [Cohnella sp. YIM B05605]